MQFSIIEDIDEQIATSDTCPILFYTRELSMYQLKKHYFLLSSHV